jgi:hypothetical protein
MFAQGVLGSAAVSAASGSAALKKSGELINAPQKVCAGLGGAVAGLCSWPMQPPGVCLYPQQMGCGCMHCATMLLWTGPAAGVRL